MSDYPKMLYRRGKIQGARLLLNSDDVWYAVAQDAAEADAMKSEAGFMTHAELFAPKPEPTPAPKRGRPRKDAQ